MFQSLDRAYKRSDVRLAMSPLRINGFNPSIGLTSVPTLSLHQQMRE